MWSIAAILLVVAAIVYLEAPALKKAKRMKELYIFSFLVAAGGLLGILQSLEVPLPNPLDWITAIHKPISDILIKSR